MLDSSQFPSSLDFREVPDSPKLERSQQPDVPAYRVLVEEEEEEEAKSLVEGSELIRDGVDSSTRNCDVNTGRDMKTENYEGRPVMDGSTSALNNGNTVDSVAFARGDDKPTQNGGNAGTLPSNKELFNNSSTDPRSFAFGEVELMEDFTSDSQGTAFLLVPQ